MVEFIEGEENNWIITDEFGRWIYTKVRNSPHTLFDEGVALLMKMSRFGADDDNYIIHTNEDPSDEHVWTSPFSLAKPEMRVGSRPMVNHQLMTSRVKKISLALYGGTTNGAQITSEFYQEKDEPASALIRIPIPESMKDEVDDEMTAYDEVTFAREQVRAVTDRYGITEDETPSSYRHPHYKAGGVRSTERMKEIYSTAFDLTERGVRQTSR